MISQIQSCKLFRVLFVNPVTHCQAANSVIDALFSTAACLLSFYVLMSTFDQRLMATLRALEERERSDMGENESPDAAADHPPHRKQQTPPLPGPTSHYLPGNPMPYMAPSVTHQPELLLLHWTLVTDPHQYDPQPSSCSWSHP